MGFYNVWFLETSQQSRGADAVIPLLLIILLSLGLLNLQKAYKVLKCRTGLQSQACLTLKSLLFQSRLPSSLQSSRGPCQHFNIETQPANPCIASDKLQQQKNQ